MQEVKINESKALRIEKKLWEGKMLFNISEFSYYQDRYMKNISFTFSVEKVNELIEKINAEAFGLEFQKASELKKSD